MKTHTIPLTSTKVSSTIRAARPSPTYLSTWNFPQNGSLDPNLVSPTISHSLSTFSRLSRVDYVEQVEEILAATQAKGARLFRRPKMSALVDLCVCSIAKTFVHSWSQWLLWTNFTQSMSYRVLRTDRQRNAKSKSRLATSPK